MTFKDRFRRRATPARRLPPAEMTAYLLERGAEGAGPPAPCCPGGRLFERRSHPDNKPSGRAWCPSCGQIYEPGQW